MDRRAFLGSMLKVAAATALPSEIWPFRKIFLPVPRPIVLQENFSLIIDPTLLPLRSGVTVLLGTKVISQPDYYQRLPDVGETFSFEASVLRAET
jgi:hypothetical protein